MFPFFILVFIFYVRVESPTEEEIIKRDYRGRNGKRNPPNPRDRDTRESDIEERDSVVT